MFFLFFLLKVKLKEREIGRKGDEGMGGVVDGRGESGKNFNLRTEYRTDG